MTRRGWVSENPSCHDSVPPSKFGGSNRHEIGNPSVYYRKQYFEALDCLIQELSDRFQQKDVISPLKRY